MAYIVLLAVIGIMGYLRVFEKYRVLLEFIRVSLLTVIPFLLITFLMLAAFTFAFTYYEEGYLEFTSLKQNFSAQYRSIHGDFTETLPTNFFEWSMFFLLTMS